jgi:hypothetical protein
VRKMPLGLIQIRLASLPRAIIRFYKLDLDSRGCLCLNMVYVALRSIDPN